MAQVANIVLPSASTDNPIGEQLLAIQQRQEALQRKQQQDNEDMVKYMTQQLDFNKFATGTAADPVINDGLNGMFMKYADRIKQNKGESMSNILFDMQQDVNKLKGYSTNVKALREQIDGNVNKYAQGAKDIDANVLKRDALSSALFKIDPSTGQPTLKDPTEIDLQQDYVGEIIKNRPEDVFGKSLFWMNDRVKAMEEVKQTGKTGVDNNGVKRTMKWSANLKPFEEIVTDPKTGSVTGVRMKTKTEKINGKDVTTLAPEVYQAMFGGTEDEFRIRAIMRRQAKENGVYVDPNTPEGEVMKRAVAYDLLKAFRPQGDFTLERDENEDVWKSKQNAGITINVKGDGSGSKTTGTDYVDAYNEIDELTKVAFAKGKATRANALTTKSYEAVIKIARERTGVNDLSAADIKLVRKENGDIYIYPAYDIVRGQTNDNPGIIQWKNNVPIAKLDKVGTDLKVNTRAPEQRTIIKEGNQKPKRKANDYGL